EKGRLLAQSAAVERLLNAFIRETGVVRITVPNDSLAHLRLPSAMRRTIEEQGLPLQVGLPLTGAVLYGSLAYPSAFGHHRYGTDFWVARDGGEPEELTTVLEMADLLLNEIALHDPDVSRREHRVRIMRANIENSLDKSLIYVAHGLEEQESLWSLDGETRMIAAEQRLFYGHPFHPTPKSSAGWSTDDLARYAPELGASFRLRYWAADPQLVREFLPDGGDEVLFGADVLEAAEGLLGRGRETFRLLPLHPWQAAHLLSWPLVEELMAQGKLVDLAYLGGPVMPTSSVRTVWDSRHRISYKLPLDVRITNFIRVNPFDQLERTADAVRVLDHLAPQTAQPGFSIIPERGYRTLWLEEETPEMQEQVAANFGVIFRESPELEQAPTVVAALLEQPPYAQEMPIGEAVRIAARREGQAADERFLKKWLGQYLQISLVPLFRLFVTHGVSMEAHVQNSMVALEQGWPVQFFVRDLEGVSVSRDHAPAFLARNSEVLYDDWEAWERLKYYFFVNHLGHLIHALAYSGSCREEALWDAVAELLQSFEDSPYLRDLFENPGLPAKANLISSFQHRGEKPSYVSIPNPLYKGKVQA
ncbi:MAG: IucA/IucC family protein, partial [Tumebacillaceae bacterium]